MLANVFDATDDQRFRLTVEGNEDNADTDLLTQQGYQSLTRATNDRVRTERDQSPLR